MLRFPIARALCVVSRRGFASSSNTRVVNAVYQPGRPQKSVPTPATACTRSPCVCCNESDRLAVLKRYGSPMKSSGASSSNNNSNTSNTSNTSNSNSNSNSNTSDRRWSAAEVMEATNRNVIFTWGASSAMASSAIAVSHGDGVYFVDMHGKRYLDFNSQAMCSHLGHTTSENIIEAITSQLRQIAYVYPGIGITEIRAKLSALLADVFPHDINSFLFPSSGSEANEIALRIARVYTGRHKVLARYRSYHGGTLGSMSLTGDQRRWPAENAASGVVHFFDPYPYSFSWSHDSDLESISHYSINYLRELIAYEGPKNIAAIFLESITGTNGVLKPPPGYLEAVREICDEHKILMVCDEVMAGFGRSGKMFGFCHAPSVVPDIVTFAKGLNAATLPLGGVGVRDFLAEHFRKNAISIGSTYNGHPVALASAYASVREILDRDLVNHAARMEKHMADGLQRLIDRHPSVKQARVVGLFGAFDLQRNRKGDFIAEVTDVLPPAMLKFKQRVLEKGLFTMMRGHTVFCNPPLIIQPHEIKQAFDIFDEALSIIDDAMED